MNGKTIIKSIHGFKITEIEAVYQPILQPASVSHCSVSYGDFILTYADAERNPITKKFGITSVEDAIGYNAFDPTPYLTRTLNVFEVR